MMIRVRSFVIVKVYRTCHFWSARNLSRRRCTSLVDLLIENTVDLLALLFKVSFHIASNMSAGCSCGIFLRSSSCSFSTTMPPLPGCITDVCNHN